MIKRTMVLLAMAAAVAMLGLGAVPASAAQSQDLQCLNSEGMPIGAANSLCLYSGERFSGAVQPEAAGTIPNALAQPTPGCGAVTAGATDEALSVHNATNAPATTVFLYSDTSCSRTALVATLAPGAAIPTFAGQVTVKSFNGVAAP